MKFSANVSKLWPDHSTVEGVRLAKAAGYEAVECYWPYEEDAEDLRAVLDECGLLMLGINVPIGDTSNGDYGLNAVAGREEEARECIDRAVRYAKQIEARNIHMLAGITDGEDALDTFIANIRYADQALSGTDIGILIEPKNGLTFPGYFLNSIDKAANVLEAVGIDRARIMFDCFHLQLLQGNLLNNFKHYQKLIGHVQFASVPMRAEPGTGEVDIKWLLHEIEKLGYDGFMGAEYAPSSPDAVKVL